MWNSKTAQPSERTQLWLVKSQFSKLVALLRPLIANTPLSLRLKDRHLSVPVNSLLVSHALKNIFSSITVSCSMQYSSSLHFRDYGIFADILKERGYFYIWFYIMFREDLETFFWFYVITLFFLLLLFFQCGWQNEHRALPLLSKCSTTELSSQCLRFNYRSYFGVTTLAEVVWMGHLVPIASLSNGAWGWALLF